MFISLNKKILFTILAFFILSSCIFLVIFNSTIGKEVRNEKNNTITRNQYIIQLLNENINLQKKIFELSPQVTTNLAEQQKELYLIKKLNEEINNNYDENYASLNESFKILGISALLAVISFVLLWFLLKRWVINPVEKLTTFSINVANGDFTQRLNNKSGKVTDEFDTLNHTVNFMIENIGNYINQIKDKEVFLQSLLDALPDSIRVIDENYNIILSNKAYNKQIKHKYLSPATKCYNAYNLRAKTPCNSSQFICPIKKLKESKDNQLKIIHSVNNRPLSINCARISLNGKFGIVEAIRDLSDNIHYSHQQKISSLGFLTTSLAHEMKNNLGAINLILDGLLQKYYQNNDKPEEKKYLSLISAQIKECILVPDRLLKISRNQDNPDSVFNITTSIDDILSLLDYEIKSKGIILKKSLNASNDDILGNEVDFKMILLNLAQNSINAMPDGGQLEILTSSNQESLTIKVIDTGHGISKESLNHIFEPFYSTSTNKDKLGTGLGLAIVKELLLKFNADISVKSKINKGSTFIITIPITKS